MIGIADDIVRAPESRPEYAHLVRKYADVVNTPKNIELKIQWVLLDLKVELERPFYLRPTFWVLLKLQLKKWIGK